LGLTNLTYQILKICNQNEKESIQKLKESTNNPLLLLKDRTIENGTSSESDTTFDDEEDLHNDRSGRKSISGFGIVPLDHEGTLGVGKGSG